MIAIQPLRPYPPDYSTPVVKLHLVNRVIKLTECRNGGIAVAKTSRRARVRGSDEGRTQEGRELARKGSALGAGTCAFVSERGRRGFLDLDAGRGGELELVAGERHVFV